MTFVLRNCLLLLFGCLNGLAWGQSTGSFENLSIDRPDVSNLPTTIRPGHFQFELGSERGHGGAISEFHVPNMVFRTGITSKSELRIGYDHIFVDSAGQNQRDNQLFAMIGGKYRFLDERGSRPSIALQAEFAIPTGIGTGFRYDHIDYNLAAYSFILLLNNTVHKQVYINYNAGIFWSRIDQLDWLASVSTSFLHTHRLGYYLEVYTLILDSGAPISFDGGVMFLIRPRLQVDIYGGQKALGAERLWFYGAGLGFRLDRGDLKPKTFKEIGVHH